MYKIKDESLSQLKARVEKLEAALERVWEWGPFPRVPGRTPDEPEMSYGSAYGSNGERDYIRDIARKALDDR